MFGRGGGGGSGAWRPNSASASASSRSLASQRDSRLRATSRLSGSHWWKAALGASGLVAGALDTQDDRAGSARAAVGDGVGGLQGERDLLRGDGVQQSLCDGLLE